MFSKHQNSQYGQNYQYQQQQYQPQPGANSLEINSIDEICPIHNVEYVAYDQQTGETLCNSCVYDGEYQSIVFNAIVAKKLKQIYDAKFGEYLESLKKMLGISSNLISTELQAHTREFFAGLKQQIQQVHQNVVNKLRQSKNLRELEEILNNVEQYFDERRVNQYKQEKQMFDSYIKSGKFVQVCKNQSRYDQVINSLDRDSNMLEKALHDSEQRSTKILKIKRDENLVKRKMNEIIENCMEVDPGLPKRQPVQQQQRHSILSGFGQGNAQQKPQQQYQQHQQQTQQRPSGMQPQQHQQQQQNQYAQRPQQVQQPSQPIRTNFQSNQAPAQNKPQEQAQTAQRLTINLGGQVRPSQPQAPQQQRQPTAPVQQQQQQRAGDAQNRQEQTQQRPININLNAQINLAKPQVPAVQQQNQSPVRQVAQNVNRVEESKPQQQQQQRFGLAQNMNLIQQQQQRPVEQAQRDSSQSPQRQMINLTGSYPQAQNIPKPTPAQPISRPQIDLTSQIAQRQVQQPAQATPQVQVRAQIQVQQEAQPQANIQVQAQVQQQQQIKAPRFSVPSFGTHFRTKGANVESIATNGQVTTIHTTKDLFLPKLTYTSDGTIFIIGGAEDMKATVTIRNLQKLTKSDNGSYVKTDLKPMNHPRASFGCSVNQAQTHIYVAGGYAPGCKTSDSCEVYDIKADTWTELPNLNKPKCSVALCEFISEGTRWLYSIGGICNDPATNSVELLDDVDRLNLDNPTEKGWEALAIKTPLKMCDAGIFQVSDKQLMIFGGWKNQAYNEVHYLDTSNERLSIKSAAVDNEKMAKSDFFLTNGVHGRTASSNNLLILGHHHLQEYDMVSKQFKSVGSD